MAESFSNLHNQIIKKYGPEKISLAVIRLCNNCIVPDACRRRLLPVTTQGKDCPYFRMNEKITWSKED